MQLGTEDWNNRYRIPTEIIIEYETIFSDESRDVYDMVFVDRILSDEEVEVLCHVTKAYTLYVVNDILLTDKMRYYFISRKGKYIDRSDIEDFLSHDARNYFSGHYGEKLSNANIAIAQGFSGDVEWNGNYSVTVCGDYGKKFNQIMCWRNNIPLLPGQALELWLEYQKDSDVEIMLSVTHFYGGRVAEVQQKWEFTEEQMQDVVIIDNTGVYGAVFFSLQARGSGNLEVIGLHDRLSRRGHGSFIPGGERYVTSKREEVFCYFDPGDMKPPLNVFFSGYKSKQGFEGYNLMHKMGCPFLLIAEPRLEGGAFYMGDEEYEQLIPTIIRKYLKELKFSNEDVIMAGISMGTFGALYYGCDILPHAMLLGKPLVSIGNVAANERVHRPGGFPTSLDVLNYMENDLSAKAIGNLNDRFWSKFNNADWSKSKFVLSYMIEDDYDSDAYESLISHLSSAGVQLYGKGIHGRHNDATGAIVRWFSSQFKKIVSDDFGRRIE